MTLRIFSSSQWTQNRSVSASFVYALILALLLASTSLQSAVLRFESAGTYLVDDMYYLDCFALIELADAPAKALVNGVELNFVVELAVHRNRRWWLDTPVFERRIRYRLFYYDLTRHFRVVEVRTGNTTNYRSLDQALRHLGSLSRYPLLPANRIKSHKRYTASVRIGLDRTRLPGPLMAQALVSRAWQMESEVFKWSLN